MKKPICAPAQSSSRRSPRRDFQKTGAIKKDATVKRTAMKAKVEECFRAPVTTTKVAPQKSEHRARERSAFNRWLMRKPLHKASRRTDESRWSVEAESQEDNTQPIGPDVDWAPAEPCRWVLEMACTPFSRSCFLFLALTSLLAGCIATGADKPETWIEVHTPHFTVVSNGNEKQARRVADHFEQIRAVMHLALPKLRVDPGQAIVILAVRNENSLKALLPGYWEVKGHLHPAGVFVAGQEKHYVALRTDTEEENPYHVIYHEYIHAILNLNFRNLPLWLEEGMAEFYGDTSIGDKEIGIGRIDAGHLRLLNQSKLLPIELLLQVDHSSSYYNEENRASVFYAESWALFHFLQTDPEAQKKKYLVNFFHAWQSSGDQTRAAQQTFGDLQQFGKKMDAYVRQTQFDYFPLKTPANLSERDFQVRTVPAAESLALRGD